MELKFKNQNVKEISQFEDRWMNEYVKYDHTKVTAIQMLRNVKESI